jgi:hypothetical protein
VQRRGITTGLDKALFEKLDPGYQAAPQTMHYLGVACLEVEAELVFLLMVSLWPEAHVSLIS